MLRFERRATSGEELAQAFLRAPLPLSFDDLVRASHGGDVREVAAWLGHALQEGMVEEAPTEVGHPRSYRLRSRGRRILSLRRRVEAA